MRKIEVIKMPVQIGAKAHNFTDPAGLLSDCHRRIEMFLAALQGIAEVIDVPPTADVIQSLESALYYFAQAAPRHNADEEDSLFPRLRQMGNCGIDSALQRLDDLEAEHRWAVLLHENVERLGKQYLSQQKLSPGEIDEFRRDIALLAAMYEKHISIEDDVILPLANRVLTASDKAAIGKEMAARRGVRVVRENLGQNRQ